MDIVLKNQVIEILEKEQDQLDGVYENQSTVGVPTSLTKKTVTQNEKTGMWEENEESMPDLYPENAGDQIEAQYEKDVIVLQQFCGEFDDQIISWDAQINALKTQIVELSTEAINRNCWPGIAYSTTTSGGTTRQTNPSLELTENFGDDFSLNQDVDNLKIFPTMWGPSVNYAATNPFDPDSTVVLTSSNSGYGYENVIANDGGSSVGTARTVSSTSGDHAGPRNVGTFRAYAGVGVAPDASLTNITGAAGQSVCVSIASSIASLESQIASLRSQRDAAVSRSDLNSVKGVKKEKELQNWGAKNTRQQVTNRKTKNSGTLSAVTNLTT